MKLGVLGDLVVQLKPIVLSIPNESDFMVTVWLIRHGESHANMGRTTAHPAAVELTEEGLNQARQIAAAFPHAPVMIVSSPYMRAQQTALLTRQRFPEVLVDEWPVQEFTYLSPPRFKNTSASDRRPASDAYWTLANPLHVDGDGAESFADLMGRVQAMKDRLKEMDGGLVAVFTHGLFIQAVLWSSFIGTIELNATGMKQFRAFTTGFNLPNGAIIQLLLNEDDFWMSAIHTEHL